jgi:hypothetical protein
MGRYLYNIGFWKEYIRSQFIKQIELLTESIQNRLIPTFDTIEKEAEDLSEKEWDRLCSSCYSPDIDPANLAEKAQEAGIDYFMTLSGIKQTLLNITATALYHLFEQQIIFFLRREVLHPSQENDIDLMKVSVFKEQLLANGIDISSFRSWNKIEELRVVSNSVKHAEGASVSKLRKLRPDMFKHPTLRNQPEMDLMHSTVCRVYLPMAGDDIFVLQDDLLDYKNALVGFWNEFIFACSDSETNMTT